MSEVVLAHGPRKANPSGFASHSTGENRLIPLAEKRFKTAAVRSANAALATIEGRRLRRELFALAAILELASQSEDGHFFCLSGRESSLYAGLSVSAWRQARDRFAKLGWIRVIATRREIRDGQWYQAPPIIRTCPPLFAAVAAGEDLP